MWFKLLQTRIKWQSLWKPSNEANQNLSDIGVLESEQALIRSHVMVDTGHLRKYVIYVIITKRQIFDFEAAQCKFQFLKQNYWNDNIYDKFVKSKRLAA